MPISGAPGRHRVVTSEREGSFDPHAVVGRGAALDDATCAGCGGGELVLFHEQVGVPALVGVQWPTADEARGCVRGDIVLGFCRRCGLVMNVAFDAKRVDYDGHYENSLDVSAVYRDYARAEAERLIETRHLRGCTVLEIGCGRGDFLQMLCELGDNRGVGLDPSTTPRPASIANDERLTFIAEEYAQRHAHLRAKLICCRQVLEHIPQPGRFLRTVREAIGDRRDTRLYLEVPSLDDVVRGGDIWTVIYEHCSYFSRHALTRLLAECGFEVTRMAETFGGSFMTVDAVPVGSVPAPIEGEDGKEAVEADTVLHLVDWCTRKVHRWRSEIRALAADGQRVALWGAGARAVTFLNLLGITDEIPFAVDINPRKEGRYLPGTAQRIVPPGFLRQYQPTAIVVMNAIYKDEIRRAVEELGLNPRYLYV